jgi:hypothetical protein
MQAFYKIKAVVSDDFGSVLMNIHNKYTSPEVGGSEGIFTKVSDKEGNGVGDDTGFTGYHKIDLYIKARSVAFTGALNAKKAQVDQKMKDFIKGTSLVNNTSIYSRVTSDNVAKYLINTIE